MEKDELPRMPAPWDLEGLGWTVLIRTPFSVTPIPLPAGAYHPLESGTSADMSSRFHGGVGAVMIVRYDSSPVGPYDELVYVPGLFSRGEGNSLLYYYSITRIWVSTEASVLNGRSNWGIPKHLAKFSFTPIPSSSKLSTLVTVSPISSTSSSSNSIPDVSTSKPFFKAILETSKYLPSFQVRTIWFANAVAIEFFGVPNQTLLQPKLPSASMENLSNLTDVQKESIQNENPKSLVGTSINYLVNLKAGGSARICYWKEVNDDEGEEEKFSGFGDGISFPKFSIYLGRGTKMKFDMKFWEPEPSGFTL